MVRWRLYIDESGDHTYKNLGDPDRRYLGLTGVLFVKQKYDEEAQPKLEILKKDIFRYDPDEPPILTRSEIRHRKRWFYVLQDAALNTRWEEQLLAYLQSLVPYVQVFTVVIDKKQHVADYPFATFDPYVYSLSVLLNRIRGYLVRQPNQADIVAESRGAQEDQQIQRAYQQLREHGSRYGDGQYYRDAFPAAELMVRKKIQNIAGLQVADVVAYGQKVLTIQEAGDPFPRKPSQFTMRVNTTVNRMVNQYGRYMLR